MNYRLTQSLPAQGKMQVTPEQSEALQKALFDMGYRWYFGTKELKHLDKPFIVWDYFDKDITQCDKYEESYFNNSIKNPLCLFEDYFETINQQ